MVEASPSDTPKTAVQGGVRANAPSAPTSMMRKSRWKRRGTSKQSKQIVAGCVIAACLGLVFLVLHANNSRAVVGPDGPFAQALSLSFPEADSRRIETVYTDDEDLPLSATLHVPAHLLEAGNAMSDPFARLETEFGGAERTLSGVEMAERLDQVARSVLPDDMARCYTYKVGTISSAPEAVARTRALHIHLNPGCE